MTGRFCAFAYRHPSSVVRPRGRRTWEFSHSRAEGLHRQRRKENAEIRKETPRRGVFLHSPPTAPPLETFGARVRVFPRSPAGRDAARQEPRGRRLSGMVDNRTTRVLSRKWDKRSDPDGTLWENGAHIAYMSFALIQIGEGAAPSLCNVGVRAALTYPISRVKLVQSCKIGPRSPGKIHEGCSTERREQKKTGMLLVQCFL